MKTPLPSPRKAATFRYGYARVSTDDQHTTLQQTALKKAGCRKIFTDEGISGGTFKRPALARCLKTLEHGDTLTVWKLDRLGRSVRDLCNTLHDLQTRGIEFESITEQINTKTTMGKMVFHQLAALAEFERGLISERTKAGIRAAQRRGVKFGRKYSLTPAQIDHAKEQLDHGKTRQEVAALLSVSRHTLWRALKD